MKFCLIILLSCFVLENTLCAKMGERTLKDDYYEIRELISQKEVFRIGFDYLLFDKEFKDFYFYLKGDEFKIVWKQVLGQSTIKNFITYLESKDLKVEEKINEIADILGLPHYELNLKDFESKRTGGFKGFFKDLSEVIPFSKIIKLYNEKRVTSTDFAEFDSKIRNVDPKKIISFIKNSPEITNFIAKISSYGINVSKVAKRIADFYEWKIE